MTLEKARELEAKVDKIIGPVLAVSTLIGFAVFVVFLIVKLLS